MSFEAVRAAAAATRDAPAPVAEPAVASSSTPPAASSPPPAPAVEVQPRPEEFADHWFAEALDFVLDQATGLSEDGSVARECKVGMTTTVSAKVYLHVPFKRPGEGRRGGPVPLWTLWVMSLVKYTWRAVTRSSKGLKAWIADGLKALKSKAGDVEKQAAAEQRVAPEPARVNQAPDPPRRVDPRRGPVDVEAGELVIVETDEGPKEFRNGPNRVRLDIPKPAAKAAPRPRAKGRRRK